MKEGDSLTIKEPISPFAVNPSHPGQNHNFRITDFFNNLEQVRRMPIHEEVVPRTCWQRFVKSCNILHPDVWVILVLLGFITALLGFAIDLLSSMLHDAHIALTTSGSGFVNFTIWILYSLVFAGIAASVGKYISTDAEGSGIPEMKAILAGINIYRYLGFQTMFGKMVGVIAANASGLSIGREGPFVHISGIIANKL
jgi:chloride channel 2